MNLTTAQKLKHTCTTFRWGDPKFICLDCGQPMRVRRPWRTIALTLVLASAAGYLIGHIIAAFARGSFPI